MSWYMNPFIYPYKDVDIDISRRRNVDYCNEIEQYLIDNGIEEFKEHKFALEDWKRQSKMIAEHSIFKARRLHQYNSVLDDEHLFRFNFMRSQTRYRQAHYVRTPYTVDNCVKVVAVSYVVLVSQYMLLGNIGFQTTLTKYHSRKQRSLMTPELREKIKKRDGYRCRICGKYMPDSVGLQIDHIVPVSKGGKTIESNLQVLCDVCNRRKSNKI